MIIVVVVIQSGVSPPEPLNVALLLLQTHHIKCCSTCGGGWMRNVAG
jgi:hypothetical protein